MKTGIVVALIVIVLVGVFLVFALNGSEENNTNIPLNDNNHDINAEVVSDSGSFDETSQGNTVEITSSGFSPSVITVSQGETVTWINQDTNKHWPASDNHPIHTHYDGTSLNEHCPNGDSFDSCEGLKQGESYSFSFDEVGTWEYHDHLRSSIRGMVVVE